MSAKILLTLSGEDVCPRFDLCTEVLIAVMGPDGSVGGRRTVVLPHPSAEDLCHLILQEGVGTVVCGGIEEEFHEYLTWKKVRVIDSVMGPGEEGLDRLVDGELRPEANLFRPMAGEDGNG